MQSDPTARKCKCYTLHNTHRSFLFYLLFFYVLPLQTSRVSDKFFFPINNAQEEEEEEEYRPLNSLISDRSIGRRPERGSLRAYGSHTAKE